MSEKYLQTIIINRNDQETLWKDRNPILRQGEIALVRKNIVARDINENGDYVKANGVIQTHAEERYYIKIGNGQNFTQIPWVDCSTYVEDWAKKTSSSYIDVPELKTNVESNTSNIASNAGRIAQVEGVLQTLTSGGSGTSINDLIVSAINGLCQIIDEDAAVENSFVTAVSREDGKICVQRRTLSENDIPTLQISKIQNLQDTLTGLQDSVTTLQAKHVQEFNELKDEVAKYTQATFLLGSGKFSDKGQALKNNVRKNGAVWLVTQDDNIVGREDQGYQEELNKVGKEYLFHTTQSDSQLSDWTISQFNDIANWTELGDVQAQDASLTQLTNRILGLENLIGQDDEHGLRKKLNDVQAIANQADGKGTQALQNIQTESQRAQGEESRIESKVNSNKDSIDSQETRISDLETEVGALIGDGNDGFKHYVDSAIQQHEQQCEAADAELAGRLTSLENINNTINYHIKDDGKTPENKDKVKITTPDGLTVCTLVFDCGSATTTY